ncbi:MAG: hypothetical protein ACTHQE_09980 [Thermomicrobiales bacterium]
MKDEPSPPTPVERRRREVILRIIVLVVVLIMMAIVGGVGLWATWQEIWLPGPITPTLMLIPGLWSQAPGRRRR